MIDPSFDTTEKPERTRLEDYPDSALRQTYNVMVDLYGGEENAMKMVVIISWMCKQKFNSDNIMHAHFRWTHMLASSPLIHQSLLKLKQHLFGHLHLVWYTSPLVISPYHPHHSIVDAITTKHIIADGILNTTAQRRRCQIHRRRCCCYARSESASCRNKAKWIRWRRERQSWHGQCTNFPSHPSSFFFSFFPFFFYFTSSIH